MLCTYRKELNCTILVYMYIRMQWALVYPTTFVPHKTCWMNQVSDKSGQICTVSGDGDSQESVE